MTTREGGIAGRGAAPLPEDELEDSRIVGRILKGRGDLFSVLLDRYQRPIFNFIYRFFGSYDIAEELTQETFVRSYQFLRSYDPKRKFSTWLYTVAKNLCIDYLKKHRPGREIPLEQVLPTVDGGNPDRAASQDPQLLCLRSEEDSRLLKALSNLEASRRIVLILYYFQGLSYQEISQALSVPITTVKIRIFRAKKALVEAINALEAQGKAKVPQGRNTSGTKK